MIKKTILVSVLAMTLTACASSSAANSPTPPAVATLSAEGGNLAFAVTVPPNVRLVIGTFSLEDTPEAVTPEQAGELLPLWQLLRTLQQSGTAAQQEIDAVFDQIQEAMTPEQLAAIERLELTPATMRSLLQERGLDRTGEGNGGQGGGFRPPSGFVPGAGGPPGGGRFPGAGPGGQSQSPEARQTAIAERFNSTLGKALMDALIELLETRAAE